MFKFGPVRNIDKVNAYLKKVPRGTIPEAIEGVAEYIVGDSRHGLKHDDPYKQTTRKRVYGQTFKSDAQRKYVMAAIKSGEIKIGVRTPNPTEASSGYKHKMTNNGYNASISNEKPGAYWTRVWRGWTNWRSTNKVVSDNIKGALRHATARVNKWLRKNGRK